MPSTSLFVFNVPLIYAPIIKLEVITMTHKNSLMTDRSWQLVSVIQATMMPHSTPAEVIEMCLSHYLHDQAEYAAPVETDNRKEGAE